MSESRVLLAWQHSLFLAISKALLSHAGVQPAAIVPADQAVTIALALHPDVIILEGRPEQALRLLHAIQADIRIFAFTLDEDCIHFYQHVQWHGLSYEAFLRRVLDPMPDP